MFWKTKRVIVPPDRFRTLEDDVAALVAECRSVRRDFSELEDKVVRWMRRARGEVQEAPERVPHGRRAAQEVIPGLTPRQQAVLDRKGRMNGLLHARLMEGRPVLRSADPSDGGEDGRAPE